MQIGVMIGESRSDKLIAKAKEVERQGFHSLWMGNFIGYRLETLHAMSLIAHETDRIKLGTAVIPIFFHHPFALAHQAISIQETSNGRFTLGVGLTHPVVVHEMLGLSYAQPIAKMREYLAILRPLLNGEAVDTKGTHYSASGKVNLSEHFQVPLLVAAMGPQMLKLTGEMADGTITFLTGPRTLESHIIPNIRASAPPERQVDVQVIACGLPIALVEDKENALNVIAQGWSGYRDFPTYRTMFDREGVNGAEGVALVGDEEELKAGLQRLEEMGVNEFVASPVDVEEGSVERTLAFLASL